MPVPALRQKANEFIAAELITEVHADHILQTIEQIRGAMRIVNDGAGADGADECGSGAADRSGVKLSREQLLNELADREEKMKSGAEADGVTDQFRVYEHIIGELQSNRPLRLMVQASAGLKIYYIMCFCGQLAKFFWFVKVYMTIAVLCIPSGTGKTVEGWSPATRDGLRFCRFWCVVSRIWLPVRLLELSANNGLLMALTRQEESTRGFQILSLWLHCVMC